MTGFSEQSELNKINFALSKLCNAYASQRISPELYRRQRSLLIEYVVNDEQGFPNLVLNEYSQAVGVHFEAENTPVIDDLGFTQESVWQEIPTVVSKTAQQNTVCEPDNVQPADEYEHEQGLIRCSPLLFDRLYWLLVVMFMVTLVIFLATGA